jgi:hypothetical protein
MWGVLAGGYSFWSCRKARGSVPRIRRRIRPSVECDNTGRRRQWPYGRPASHSSTASELTGT